MRPRSKRGSTGTRRPSPPKRAPLPGGQFSWRQGVSFTCRLTKAGRRSTKAEAGTPATQAGVAIAQRAHLGRSTKAGAGTPATPGDKATRPARTGSTLNEGRGRNPGDTQAPLAVGRSRCPLNEGRGRNPGDTSRWRAWLRCRRPSLNEGRGRNPGDTGLLDAEEAPDRARSTKAGAGTPATPAEPWASSPAPTRAQRRPGPEPRRHEPHVAVADAQLVRSTKAGAGTPATRGVISVRRSSLHSAQRRPGPEPRRHRRQDDWQSQHPQALNEGRGRNPGDTINPQTGDTHMKTAQRRPGPEPRRHEEDRRRYEMRMIVAQRRPGPEPRRHRDGGWHRGIHALRSTKAGAGTPATPGAAMLTRELLSVAQRRPGPELRRHWSGRSCRPIRPAALNEGRGRNPGDTTANR